MTPSQREIIDWLLAPQVRDLDDAWMFSQLIRRMLDAGVPLWRASTSVRTKYAEVGVRDLMWRRGAGTELVVGSALDAEPESPENLVGEQRDWLRIRLEAPPDTIPFRIAYDLKSEGGTDFVLFRLPMSSGSQSFVWWATDRSGGFGGQDLELLRALVPALSIRIEVASYRYALEELLLIYLGPMAARRVQAGEARRGPGERLAAVLWLSDLHGFASLVERQPSDRVLHALDAYIDCVSRRITQHGGMVLSLHGDGVVAAFPTSGRVRESVCAAALSAAREAFSAMAELNADRRAQSSEAITFRVALHVGVVTYGAVGPGAPLHHIALGPAVDELFALESLCKKLSLPLLVSGSFARSARSADLESIGAHEIHQSDAPVELWTLKAFARQRA